MFVSPYNYMCYNEMMCYSRNLGMITLIILIISCRNIVRGLMLFPAHLEHKVLENKSDEDENISIFQFKFTHYDGCENAQSLAQVIIKCYNKDK